MASMNDLLSSMVMMFADVNSNVTILPAIFDAAPTGIRRDLYALAEPLDE